MCYINRVAKMTETTSEKMLLRKRKTFEKAVDIKLEDVLY